MRRPYLFRGLNPTHPLDTATIAMMTWNKRELFYRKEFVSILFVVVVVVVVVVLRYLPTNLLPSHSPSTHQYYSI
jgi:hypothetical protein